MQSHILGLIFAYLGESDQVQVSTLYKATPCQADLMALIMCNQLEDAHL